MQQLQRKQFEEVSLKDWRGGVEAALNSKSIEQALSSETWDGIVRQPIYTADMLSEKSYEGDWCRGMIAEGAHHDWGVGAYLQDLVELWQEDLQQQVTFFQINEVSWLWDPDLIQSFISHVNEPIIISHPMDAEMAGRGESHWLTFPMNSKITAWTNHQGGLLALLAGQLQVAEKIRQNLASWFEAETVLNKMNPSNKKALAVAPSHCHSLGATPVQEIAWSLAATIDLMRHLGVSHSLDKIVAQTSYHWAFDSDYFEQVSKIRAFRLLLADLHLQLGLKPQRTVIKGECSQRMMTGRDEWNNVLRSTLSMSAATLAGVDYYVARPFDGRTSAVNYVSHRLARTSQLVLKEESQLHRVMDPLGGAWYVEALTEEMAALGWALFQEIEERGGLWQAVQSGWWQGQLAESRRKREMLLAKRQPVIVGVSDFTLGADLKTPLSLHGPKGQGVENGSQTKPLALNEEGSFYDSDTFELLVERNNEFPLPAIWLLNLGPLSEHNPRTIFSLNFLAAGGLTWQESPSLKDTVMAVDAWQEGKWPHLVICSSDKFYDENLPDLVSQLKKMGACSIWLAGRAKDPPTQKVWLQAGVSGFIYKGCDVVETLREIMKTMGGKA